jgi:ABC-type glycerol-3-phosphate transport system substrate-binding protein
LSITRRRFLAFSALAIGPVLAACGGAAPTAVPAKPTEAPKPAAAAPTTAPASSGPPAAPPAAPTTAPAAPSGPPSAPAKPTEASKPAVPAASGPSTTGPVTLRFMKFAPPGWTLDQKYTEDFNKANPNIQVKIEEVIYGEMDKKVLAAAAADTMGDVFPGHNRWSPYHAFKGLALDLDPLVKSNPAEVKFEDFFPSVIADARGLGADGKLFLLPTVVHPGGNAVVAFNLDLLEKSGQKMPTKDWTIAQYEEIVRKAADPKNGIFGTHINMSAPLYATQAIRSWSTTAEKSSDDSWLVSRDGKKQQLDAAPVKTAYEWYQKLVRDGITPAQTDYATTAGSGADHFVAGKMVSRAMESSSPHNAMNVVKDKFKIGYTLWPKGPAGHRGSALSYNLHMISSKTKAPEAAFKFISVLTGPEIAFQYGFEGVGQPYARRSAWTNPKLWEKYPGIKDISEWFDQGIDPYPRPWNLRAQEHQTIFAQEIQAYLDNKENWEQMFAHVQKKGQEVIDLPRP